MRRSNGSAACACRAARNMSKKRLCTKNTSWALIERPYSCAPQAVGAVYDRPGFFVQSPSQGQMIAGAGKRLFRTTSQLMLMDFPSQAIAILLFVKGIAIAQPAPR